MVHFDKKMPEGIVVLLTDPLGPLAGRCLFKKRRNNRGATAVSSTLQKTTKVAYYSHNTFICLT